jgi:hypothetical protein
VIPSALNRAAAVIIAAVTGQIMRRRGCFPGASSSSEEIKSETGSAKVASARDPIARACAAARGAIAGIGELTTVE